MALKIPSQFPLDNIVRKAVGVGIPFSGVSDAVFNLNYTTKDQIKANLINYFLTNKGERILEPNYGADLRKFIFEQISNNTIEDLNEIFKSKIEQQFPRVRVFDVVINADPDVNTINISFT